MTTLARFWHLTNCFDVLESGPSASYFDSGPAERREVGGELPLVHQRFASVCPATATAGWFDHAMPYEYCHGLFTRANALVIDPSVLADILGTHQCEGTKCSSFVITHSCKLPDGGSFRNVRRWVGSRPAACRVRRRYPERREVGGK